MGSVVPKPLRPRPKPVAPSPTQAEVSQSAATDAYQEKKKRRRGGFGSLVGRGRSATIMTGSGGIAATPTLGKKSLLGE